MRERTGRMVKIVRKDVIRSKPCKKNLETLTGVNKITKLLIYIFLKFRSLQSLEKNQPLPSASSSTSAQPKKTARQSTTLADNKEDGKDDGMLDIRTLREKSRNLDLPLISALCNDRYLLRQTKAFVLPIHPSETGASSSLSKSGIRSSNGGTSSSSRNKYPVSGLSTTQISKPPRKSSTSTHRHPAETKGNSYNVTTATTTTTSVGLPSSARKDPTRASHS